MRKADYAALAQAIMRVRLDAEDNYPSELTQAKCSALDCVARLFADRASVDKAQFLKACGVE